jgi:cell division transport system permease protein
VGQAVNRVLSMLKLLVRGVSMRPWASLATLIACWFALCQLMLVFHAAAFASRAKTLSGASGTVIAYLSGRPDTGAVRALGERIAAMEEIAGVEFIPCSTGLERLRQWLGPDDSLVRDLDPKVLPDAFEIRLKPGHAGSLERVAERLGGLSGIQDVRYDRGILGMVADAYYPILAVGVMVFLVVVLTLSLVIFLSIRVAMVSRRQEMEVMHLLGAKRYFLYSPYLLEALMYSVLSAILALLSVEGVFILLKARVPVLGPLLGPMSMDRMIAAIVLAGLLSLPAAYMAIRRSVDA